MEKARSWNSSAPPLATTPGAPELDCSMTSIIMEYLPTTRLPNSSATPHDRKRNAGGGKLNEGALKDITGGDTLRGCRKYEHSFNFKSTAKVWLAGNHKPTIRGTDDGIWRRVPAYSLRAAIRPRRTRRESAIQAPGRVAGNCQLAGSRLPSLATRGTYRAGDCEGCRR
jgi:hypothetical protein